LAWETAAEYKFNRQGAAHREQGCKKPKISENKTMVFGFFSKNHKKPNNQTKKDQQTLIHHM
jgi:hypothetical protein